MSVARGMGGAHMSMLCNGQVVLGRDGTEAMLADHRADRLDYLRGAREILVHRVPDMEPGSLPLLLTGIVMSGQAPLTFEDLLEGSVDFALGYRHASDPSVRTPSTDVLQIVSVCVLMGMSMDGGDPDDDHRSMRALDDLTHRMVARK